MSNENPVTLYEFKITLKHITPKIWRRVRIPSNYNFKEMHIIIQESMGWFNKHLHQFQLKNPHTNKKEIIAASKKSRRCYIDHMWVNIFGYDKFKHVNGKTVKLSDYFKNPNDKGVYQYDLGDKWVHLLVLENIIPISNGLQLVPKCMEGERACPPENAGGVPGYAILLTILKNPEHPEYEDKIEWLKYIGREDFDSEKFDPDNVCLGPGDCSLS